MLFDEGYFTRLESLRQMARRAARRRRDLRPLRVGQGVAFSGHRPYAPGDDPRHVDWSLYSRTGRLQLKQYEERGPIEVLILLDRSGSMGDVAWRTGARLSAAATLLGLAAGDRARLFCFHREGTTRWEGRTPRATAGLWSHLESITPEGPSGLIRPPLSGGSRGGVALIVSDFLFDPAPLRGHLRWLRYRGFRPALIRLVPPRILPPDGFCRLKSREEPEERAMNFDARRRAALEKRSREHARQLRGMAGSERAIWESVPARTSFEAIIERLFGHGLLLP